MMRKFRAFSTTWPAKILLSLMFVSFLSWGISDVVTTVPYVEVITVGDRAVDSETFRSEYLNAVLEAGNQLRRTLSSAEARELGIGDGLVHELAAELSLDVMADELGLVISPEDFQARARISHNYAQLITAEQERLKRNQLTDAIAGTPFLPQALEAVFHRFSSETRSVDYLTLSAETLDAGVIEDPSADTLQAHYKADPTRFALPEVRTADVIDLAPETVARNLEISESDIRSHFLSQPDRWSLPERRHIRRLAFESREEAEALRDELREGLTFSEAIARRGVPEAIADLGFVDASSMADAQVAHAAFALDEGQISPVVETPLGFVLLEIVRVNPAVEGRYEDLRDEIRDELASDLAGNTVYTMFGEIEDARAAGSTLAEVAAQMGLPYTRFDRIDSHGIGPDGTSAAIFSREPNLIGAIYSADPLVETEPIQSGNGGFVWYEVVTIDPARVPAFTEVRTAVESDWRNQALHQQLRDQAALVVTRLNRGETVESLATELGLNVERAPLLRRTGAQDPAHRALVATAFTIPVGVSASVVLNDEAARLVFTVTDATVATRHDGADTTDTQLSAAFTRQELAVATLQDFSNALRNRPNVAIDHSEISRILTPEEYELNY